MKPIFVRESPGSLESGNKEWNKTRARGNRTDSCLSILTSMWKVTFQHLYLFHWKFTLYIRTNVVQKRLAEHVQVPRLYCIMGYVEDEKVNSRLGRPQLWRSGKTQASWLHTGHLNTITIQRKAASIKLCKPTIYSEGAINSMVAFWTSGLLCGSPYDLLTGLYINSSGTENRHSQDI